MKEVVTHNLEAVVLHCLHQKPSHGYSIIKRLRSEYRYYCGPSTMYPLLTSLTKRGCATSKWQTSGPKPCKIYVLTPQGESLCKQQSFFLAQLSKDLNKP